VTFLYGQGDLATEFGAELDPGRYGGKDDLCVKLTPKKPRRSTRTSGSSSTPPTST